jgi:hypothetical protein
VQRPRRRCTARNGRHERPTERPECRFRVGVGRLPTAVAAVRLVHIPQSATVIHSEPLAGRRPSCLPEALEAERGHGTLRGMRRLLHLTYMERRAVERSFNHTWVVPSLLRFLSLLSLNLSCSWLPAVSSVFLCNGSVQTKGQSYVGRSFKAANY